MDILVSGVGRRTSMAPQGEFITFESQECPWDQVAAIESAPAAAPPGGPPLPSAARPPFSGTPQASVAVASPPRVRPGPGEPGFCGAHTSGWDCWYDVSPVRPGEVVFINETLTNPRAGIPTDPDRLLQIARGICQSLAGGTSPNYVVKFLAEDLGISEDQAAQGLFINANKMACS